MATQMPKEDQYESIPFRMHPRIFAALGSELITNDVVAVIELVKNSYDAFARNVWVRILNDSLNGQFLEVEDDGQGMTKDIIENVWCLVATPFKEEHPNAIVGKKIRRVAGEKGLGRLSAARLGERFHMLTQAPNSDCWEVEVNWSDLYSVSDISKCYAKCRKYNKESPFKKTGTKIRITGLKNVWNESIITDLQENLSRLISPFSDLGDFNIFLMNDVDKLIEQSVNIKPPVFLSKPKYSIKGKVDNKGTIKCTYRFSPIREGKTRERDLLISWEQIYDHIQDRDRFKYKPNKFHCGSFFFEIRAWDIGGDDKQEISEKYDIHKNLVRKAIQAHKGISVYRDGVLVLPKSDKARDWLGLDLRRVSKVGTRLSTSQIVGYVSISSESNPNIKDTSDRERLKLTLEVAEFEELLMAIIRMFENELNEDRKKPDRGKPMQDLFQGLSADKIVSDVEALADEGAEAKETVPIIRAFSEALDATRITIQERFVYYSRLATIGTIAQMLVHEIRNRTNAFDAFLRYIKSTFSPFQDKKMENKYGDALDSVNALERLADTFSPLSSRSFRRRKRHSILEERIQECITLHYGEIKRKEIKCNVPKSKTHVSVDPGELDAILINLITNAVYWLSQVPKVKREIDFNITFIESGRVRVWIHDTGPGIHEDDLEIVFLPGVTRKPDGIGMGLTVASELVSEYGGKMFLKHPGTKGGASFAFDLPLIKKDTNNDRTSN